MAVGATKLTKCGPRTVTLLSSAVLVLAVSSAAQAKGPVALSDGQLDRVTAGTVSVQSSANAAATGSFSLTNTATTSYVVLGSQPWPDQPGLLDSAGFTDSSAVAQGADGTDLSGPTPSASTGVSTATKVAGSNVISANYQYTIYGAGGLTMSGAWSAVDGYWSGL